MGLGQNLTNELIGDTWPKRIVVGWFILQCWFTAFACLVGVLLLIGVFGEANSESALQFLQGFPSLGWMFPSQIIAAIILSVGAAASLAFKVLIEKFLFKLIILAIIAFAAIWMLLKAGPHLLN